MALHAFVAMPFGLKDGIDFNRIYGELIKPALERAGFEVFRADEELRAGEIRKDMFQELLLADLVVVDLSIDNPNVWYELGVRHALRARGVVQILCRRERLPFDVASDRVLRYQEKDGAPDPATLAADRERLARFAAETINAWHGWKVSPVYQLVPYLKEPDWRSLQVKDSTEFWDVYEDWSDRIEIARRRNRAGDILVLAEETPTWILRKEARRMAGKALLQLGQFRLALEQFEAALAIDPEDSTCHQQIGILLGRLDRFDEAREWIKDIVERHPTDPESWSLLGRLEKTEWVRRWRAGGGSAQQMRARAAAEEALLLEAIEPYTNAFTQDPRHFYSGINAVTLRHLQRHLGGEIRNSASLPNLEGGVLWACLSALERTPKDYWARASFADLNLLLSDKERVIKEYRSAVAVADKDWFALDSSRQTLTILRDLEFRPEVVAAALDVLEQELTRLSSPLRPRQVFLFSGHMIDKPDRSVARFPPDREGAVAAAIAGQLARLGGGPEDLGICGGACGGDLLFAEACLAHGMRLCLHLQFDEPAFLEASVAFAGESWRNRYFSVKASPLTETRIQPEQLGAPPKGSNPYARNNLWQLYTALAYGPEQVRFIALWDGKEGDGPGGTRHMVDSVKQHSGQVYILDMKSL